jgi:SAM-dependent methyltransferase
LNTHSRSRQQNLPAVPVCPDCGSRDPNCVGDVISFGQFAGGLLIDGSRSHGCVYSCAVCALVFKFPAIDAESALRLYNESSGGVWSGSAARPEFEFAREILNQSIGLRPLVLDVGCNRGEFLRSLPPEIAKFGVEVNENAAVLARQQGVQVWDSVEAIPEDHLFDMVTCFDVVEHVRTPSAFLRQLVRLLKPGGFLVLSSGDASFFLSQFRPSRNWYFSNPEHVSFISRKWLAGCIAGISGCAVRKATNFLHGRRHDGIVARVKIFLYKLSPRVYLGVYRALKRLAGSRGALFVPGNGSSQDHLCVLIQRASVA